MTFEGSTTARDERIGLPFWMDRVVRECERVGRDLAPSPVHDLRVALRHCRSIADGYRTFDPHRTWKEMKKEGKTLFKKLGALRDAQVMIEWIRRLAPDQDPAGKILSDWLANREAQAKTEACEALAGFKIRKWVSWSRQLANHVDRIPLDSAAFQHLALERWHLAHELHRQALRNRSQIAFHRLRIGLKRFRYTVENFLPQRHEPWSGDLRELQDLLGDLHDLHVLWRTALGIGVLRDAGVRSVWRLRIHEERKSLLDQYRRKMAGKASLWPVWRSALPGNDWLRAAAMARLQAWASFRDPDVARTEHVTRLALQLYDGLKSEGLVSLPDAVDARFILHTAALLHEVGLMAARKKHQRASCRMIRKLAPPLGYTADDLRLAALVARYHRGALPRPSHQALAPLTGSQQRMMILNAGILRLASAFGSSGDRSILRLEVKRGGDAVLIAAEGYDENDPLAAKLAGARYLLEVACRMPVLIRSGNRA